MFSIFGFFYYLYSRGTKKIEEEKSKKKENKNKKGPLR
jgi:hypothetical protein